ncbi:hypothetical protein [Paludisphaera rhizosphaerae]|uniref:hypothetical protein n=1 Tax=Paludisphaera rhizosphaerae TaxID=2711216 RepID=UPI0013EC950C|nr:hypothetical protein [Paludisphaera rhizosphaerae]
MSDYQGDVAYQNLRMLAATADLSRIIRRFNPTDAVVDRKRSHSRGDGWRVEAVGKGWPIKGSPIVTLFKMPYGDHSLKQVACRCLVSVESVPRQVTLCMDAELPPGLFVTFNFPTTSSRFSTFRDESQAGQWLECWAWVILNPKQRKTPKKLEITIYSNPDGFVDVKDLVLYDATGLDLSDPFSSL